MMSDSRSNKISQRRYALLVLARVLSDRQQLDWALESVPQEFRSWVHEGVAGTLRYKGRLDYIIDQLTLKKKASGNIRKALLLATYQLLEQPHVPQAWVVSETVDLVRSKEGESAARFVNAILRKITDHLESWQSLSWPRSSLESESVKWASLPEWLWRRIVSDYGLEWSKQFAEASLKRPHFWFRSKQQLLDFKPGPIPESWELDTWSPVHELETYREGRVFVQDISSQRLIYDFCLEASRLLGETRQKSILDLCAAPGGKSSGLAWNGWKVLSTDREADTQSSQERFQLLLETQRRVNAGGAREASGSIQVISRSEVKGLKPVDAVWVDAPCTGTGLLRRHPEIRWIKDEKTLVSLQKDQSALLEEAASLVRTEGLLMYTVCSILRSDELERALNLEVFRGFRRIREWQLFPQVSPYGDGFLGVLLQKV